MYDASSCAGLSFAGGRATPSAAGDGAPTPLRSKLEEALASMQADPSRSTSQMLVSTTHALAAAPLRTAHAASTGAACMDYQRHRPILA
jgi:hypothetical protein